MITVLMPTYNCAPYISDAIKSVLRQSFQEFEFLIIDDGSSDRTKEIVNSFHDSRIRYVRREHVGLSESLNYGLQISSFDLIARMDADDLMAQTRLTKQFLKFMSIKPTSILSCWCACFKDEHIRYIINSVHESKLIKKGLLLHAHFPHSGVMYRKDLVLGYGGYKGDVFEDYELWLRMVSKVDFYVIPEVLQFQRLRNDSLSRKDMAKKLQQYYIIQEPYYASNLQIFDIESDDEKLFYKGWREYFFGKKNEARYYWQKLQRNELINYKLLLAYLISYLPEKFIIILNMLSLRYRMRYAIRYFSKESRLVRTTFKAVVQI